MLHAVCCGDTAAAATPHPTPGCPVHPPTHPPTRLPCCLCIETFLRAAELIGVQPSACVGYEDAALGMEAIRAAGFLLAVDVTTMPGYPRLTP